MNAVLDALHNLGFDWHVALANLVNFLIIFYILKRFFFGSISETLKNRRDKIEKGLNDAKEADLALSQANDTKTKILNEAQVKASELLVASETRAKKLGDTMQEDAQKKADSIIESVQQRETAIKAQNELELNQKVPGLAAKAVEKILMEKMSAEENQKFINKLLA
jgi:F-type H+-transporting ATPase subunit b